MWVLDQLFTALRVRHPGDPQHRIGEFAIGKVGELERELAPRDDVNDPAQPRVDVEVRPETDASPAARSNGCDL